MANIIIPVATDSSGPTKPCKNDLKLPFALPESSSFGCAFSLAMASAIVTWLFVAICICWRG